MQLKQTNKESHMYLHEYLFRNRKNFTMKDMALRLGLTRTYFSKIVNLKKVPSIDIAKKIEKETGGLIKWAELMETNFNEVNGIESYQLKNPVDAERKIA